MSTEIDHKPPQPPRVPRSSCAADERTVRRIGARIFADLLPGRTSDLATVPSALRPGPSSDDPEWSQSDWETIPLDSAASVPHLPTTQAGKETFTMRAYRTE